MAEVVTVKGVPIGQGMPKICVPLVSPVLDGLLAELTAAAGAGADLVEWRADGFAALADEAAVLAALQALLAAAGSLPLLFTLRSTVEGGSSTLPPQAAAALLGKAARAGADMVDAEVFYLGDTLCREVLAAAHAAGAVVVLSSHDFAATPPKDEMAARLGHMRELGADLPKLAVMPASAADTLVLLEVTRAYVQEYGSPLITMAMGPQGLVSRIAGESFGSAVTFGAGLEASAPGQMDARELRGVLEALHKALHV